jgi:hypothetical protein
MKTTAERLLGASGSVLDNSFRFQFDKASGFSAASATINGEHRSVGVTNQGGQHSS